MSARERTERARRSRIQLEQRQYIASKTDGGTEIVDFMLALARDPDAETKERRAAFEWLQDHGIGKAAERHEVDVTVTQDEPSVDLSNLTLEELREYERLQAKIVGTAALPAPAEPVEQVQDAEIVGEGEP